MRLRSSRCAQKGESEEYDVETPPRLGERRQPPDREYVPGLLALHQVELVRPVLQPRRRSLSLELSAYDLIGPDPADPIVGKPLLPRRIWNLDLPGNGS